MSKRVLYLIRRRPGVLADETTDLMLVSGVFEQPTSVLFIDDGVYQLLGLDTRQATIKALPTYDIDDLHVSVESLASRGISADGIQLAVRGASRQDVRDLLANHDVVLTD